MTNKKSKHNGVSDETLEKFYRDFTFKFGGGLYTVQCIADELKVSKSAASIALRYLLSTGRVKRIMTDQTYYYSYNV